MVIALLVLLGVDLVVVLVIAGIVISRKRWLLRQPEVFKGAIRVSEGEIHGLRPKWSRGYGRWVNDVFVWTKAPLLFRNEILASDGLHGQRPAKSHEIKRLGEHPTVVSVGIADATAEIASNAGHSDQLLGPYLQATPHI